MVNKKDILHKESNELLEIITGIGNSVHDTSPVFKKLFIKMHDEEEKEHLEFIKQRFNKSKESLLLKNNMLNFKINKEKIVNENKLKLLTNGIDVNDNDSVCKAADKLKILALKEENLFDIEKKLEVIDMVRNENCNINILNIENQPENGQSLNRNEYQDGLNIKEIKFSSINNLIDNIDFVDKRRYILSDCINNVNLDDQNVIIEYEKTIKDDENNFDNSKNFVYDKNMVAKTVEEVEKGLSGDEYTEIFIEGNKSKTQTNIENDKNKKYDQNSDPSTENLAFENNKKSNINNIFKCSPIEENYNLINTIDNDTNMKISDNSIITSKQEESTNHTSENKSNAINNQNKNGISIEISENTMLKSKHESYMQEIKTDLYNNNSYTTYKDATLQTVKSIDYSLLPKKISQYKLEKNKGKDVEKIAISNINEKGEVMNNIYKLNNSVRIAFTKFSIEKIQEKKQKDIEHKPSKSIIEFFKEIFLSCTKQVQNTNSIITETKISPFIFKLGKHLILHGSIHPKIFTEIASYSDIIKIYPQNIQKGKFYDLNTLSIGDNAMVFIAYIREVLNGLFPDTIANNIFKMYKEASNCNIIEEKEILMTEISYKIQKYLPFTLTVIRHKLLVLIFELLKSITENYETTKVDIKRLASLFAPSMLANVVFEEISDLKYASEIIEIMYCSSVEEIEKDVYSDFLKLSNY